MGSKQQIDKDRQRINELIDGIRYEMANCDIAIEALRLANRYITKADNQRIMLNQIKDKTPKAGKLEQDKVLCFGNLKSKCKHCHVKGDVKHYCYCDWWNSAVDPRGWCNYGEREEKEGKE